MNNIQEILKTIDAEPFIIGTEHSINITYVRDPHDFYVRSAKYLSVVLKIEKLKHLPRLYEVELEQVVLFETARTSITSKHVRGRIQNIEKMGNFLTYTIYAMDYGFVEHSVSIDRIFHCDKLLLVIPAMAYNCQLGQCARKKESWGMATDAFKTFVSKNDTSKMIIEGVKFNKLIIQLINTSPNDISTLLAITEFTTFGYGENAVNKLHPVAKVRASDIAAYKFKDLKTNVPIRVRVLTGKSLEEFYVADVNDYNEYLNKRNEFTCYSKRQVKIEEGSLKNGDMVCVRDFLNMYERSVVTEVVDAQTAHVYMVDTGRKELVHHMNMRKIPDQLVSVPAVAIYCRAEKHIETNLLRLFHTGNEFDITVKHLGQGFSFPNIVKINQFKF